MSALLRKAGHCLREAKDGIEGLAAIRAKRPDLVISDALMPSMDGYQFISRVRRAAATRSLPVILYVPNYSEREARELAPSLGVSQVLRKPAAPEAIVAAVERALSKAPQPEALPEPGAAAIVSDPESTVSIHQSGD